MPPSDHDRDHDAILRRLEDISTDIKGMLEAFRTHSDQCRRESHERINEIWATISDEKRRVDDALRKANDARAIIWKVGGAAIVIAVGAIAKAIGVY